MANENFIAFLLVLAAFLASYLHLADTHLLDMIVTAYLGFLTGRRVSYRKEKPTWKR